MGDELGMSNAPTCGAAAVAVARCIQEAARKNQTATLLWAAAQLGDAYFSIFLSFLSLSLGLPLLLILSSPLRPLDLNPSLPARPPASSPARPPGEFYLVPGEREKRGCWVQRECGTLPLIRGQPHSRGSSSGSSSSINRHPLQIDILITPNV